MDPVVVVQIGSWCGVQVEVRRPGTIAEVDLVLRTEGLQDVPQPVRALGMLLWPGRDQDLEDQLASSSQVVLPYDARADELMLRLVDLLADVRVRSPRYRQGELVLLAE